MRFILFITFILFAFNSKGNDSLNCVGKLDKAGKKHGTWVCRNNKGKLMRKERFSHGDMITWMLYNEKGQMVQSKNKKGKIKKYNPCGC